MIVDRCYEMICHPNLLKYHLFIISTINHMSYTCIQLLRGVRVNFLKHLSLFLSLRGQLAKCEPNFDHSDVIFIILLLCSLCCHNKPYRYNCVTND